MLLAQLYPGLDALLDRQARWVAANVRLFRLRPELLAKLEAATLQRVVAHIAQLVYGLDPHPGRVRRGVPAGCDLVNDKVLLEDEDEYESNKDAVD
jgi:hypothetical protein